jgi:hypothetical protein
MVCDFVPSKYDIKKNEVCNVAEELFGQNFFGNHNTKKEGFIGDFLITPNPESQVRAEIADLANIRIEDVERYVYLSTFNGATVIKK